MIEKEIENLMTPVKPGVSHSTTHKFRGSSGTKMYITIGVDEYNVVNSLMINIGSSGTTIHNVCNALGRVISIAIQNDKATLIQIVQTLEDVSSETRWMSDSLGNAESIPSAIALVLLHCIEVDDAYDKLHNNFSEECDSEFKD
jgi:hypothetical protein